MIAKSKKSVVNTIPVRTGRTLANNAKATLRPGQRDNAATPRGPLSLALDLIDEDPEQPRTKDNPGFSTASIAELASTISARGVKSPISVRDNLDVVGRYIINHGARRYRASKAAGKQTIPGFIDNDYSEADQVIENLQRNELTAREIADYIGRELSKGNKKGEIAKSIGKSPAFVTQHVTLLDLPDPIAVVFNSGRVNDVTVVNELVIAFKKKPNEVSAWLKDKSQEVTRSSVKFLRDFLDEKHKREVGDDERAVSAARDLHEQMASDTSGESDAEVQQKEKPSDVVKLKKATILVRHLDRAARLLFHRRPLAEGTAWIKFSDDGSEMSVLLSDVALVSIRED